MSERVTTRDSHAQTCGIVELLAINVWATVLLVAAIGKLQGCDKDMTVVRLAERIVPSFGCELLIVGELLLGAALLFANRSTAWLLGVLSAALCGLGNTAMWLREGDVDCGCLGAYGATHGSMAIGATVVVLLASLGRSWGVGSRRLQRVAAWACLGIALVLAAADTRYSPPSDSWWPALAKVAGDGDVLLFGSSSCEACRAVVRDGKLVVDGRSVAIADVVLVHPARDMSANSSHFRTCVPLPEDAWWNAVGASAPAVYVVRGGEAHRAKVQRPGE
jgi:hypothetical protein